MQANSNNGLILTNRQKITQIQLIFRGIPIIGNQNGDSVVVIEGNGRLVVTIQNGVRRWGPAQECHLPSAIIDTCTVMNNISDGYGGGVYRSGTISGCIIEV